MAAPELTEWELKCFPSLNRSWSRYPNPSQIDLTTTEFDMTFGESNGTQSSYQCEVCHALILNWKDHAAWHAELGK